MLEPNEIYCGDCREVLKELDTNSVDSEQVKASNQRLQEVQKNHSIFDVLNFSHSETMKL